MKYRIGLDISGGDLAPYEPLKGAELARKEYGAEVVLIGLKNEIEEGARKDGISLAPFEIIEAKEKIEMAEAPAISVRRKRKSSLVIGVDMLKRKKIDAFVSCGNTGAAVCAGALGAGMLPGVDRPGIGTVLPTLKGNCFVIDVGANIDPKPLHLFQYGIMAAEYFSLVMGKKNPSVGLLNIGEEESKGPEFVKVTHRLFSNASLNFIGNLEARDLFSGKCDCIVCDGFVGNVALKLSEGFAETMGKFLLASLKRDLLGKLGLFFLKRTLKRFKKITDYSEYGGAPLLGIDGVLIIGHGRSTAYAIKNAVKVSIEELDRGLNQTITRRVNEICQDSRIREILTA